MRFTWFCCSGDGFEPWFDSVTTSWLLLIATSLMMTPSTTYSGADRPLRVDTPRSFTWMPPPGAPEFCWIAAQISGPDRRDRVRRVALLDSGRLPRHDDAFQVEDVRLEPHLDDVLARRHRDGAPFVADAADQDRKRLVRSAERELAPIARHGTDARPDDRDAR